MARWLFAFDLDGTLLRSDKSLSPANLLALREMVASGSTVALASGRLGSSVAQFNAVLGFEPSLLTLNGAAVYHRAEGGYAPVYSVPLDKKYSDELLAYAESREFACNCYIDGKLFSVRNDQTAPWIDLYYAQTRTHYEYVDSLASLRGTDNQKMLFVGDPRVIDKEEKCFRARWDRELYIVRTWDYYLEFMNPNADKGKGLDALARACGVTPEHVVAFGDADNDIPMLRHAGLGIAMQNASPRAKDSAARVSQWTNDEDAVAREWQSIRKTMAA